MSTTTEHRDFRSAVAWLTRPLLVRLRERSERSSPSLDRETPRVEDDVDVDYHCVEQGETYDGGRLEVAHRAPEPFEDWVCSAQGELLGDEEFAEEEVSDETQ